MYAWEKPFNKIVSITRALEIKKIKLSAYVRTTNIATIVFTQRLLLYFTLIMFVLSGNNLNADVTYTLATFFNIIQLTAVFFFSTSAYSTWRDDDIYESIRGASSCVLSRFELRYKLILLFFVLTYLLND